MIHYVITFSFYFLWFLLDFIFAGIVKTFSFHSIRFLVYFTIIRGGTPFSVAICGLLMLLESFVTSGSFGLDLCIAVPLAVILYAVKDTFDNHWLLQIAASIICYLVHGYVLQFFEKLV